MGTNRVSSVEGVELCKVWEVKTLGRERDAEARRLLQNVAAQVQPIMRKRQWRVPLLSEFSPRQPNLLGLNINHGKEIRIRLRHHGRDSDFYDYESLLGTMLHELAHIQHGAHDWKFYKLLDEIAKECEELIAKGIKGTGQGFDAPGQRLSNVSHNPPASLLRKSALSAAEKRQRLSSLMPSGPQKLGGDVDMRQLLTPAQAAAMAAEKRLQDDLWCAAPETVGENAYENARAKEETVTVPSDAGSSYSNVSRPSKRAKLTENENSEWECAACTLLNPPLAPICAACESPKPGPPSSAKTWTCKLCTTDNLNQRERCISCNEWRFSTTNLCSNFQSESR